MQPKAKSTHFHAWIESWGIDFQLPRELQNHVGVPHLWLNSLPHRKSRGQTRIVQQTTLKCWWTSKKMVELKSNPVSNMNSPRWDVEKPDSVVITMFAKNISVFLGVCGRTCMQLCTSMQFALQPSCLLLWTWAGMEACGPTLPKDGPSIPHLWWGKVDRCRQHATVSNKWLDNIFTQSRGVQLNIIQEGSAPKEKMVAHNHKQFHARAVCEKPKFVLCVWKPQRQCQWPKTLLGQRPKIIEAPPPWTPAAVPAICKKMDGSPCHSLE